MHLMTWRALGMSPHSRVLINCRNNRKLLGRVKAFDRHCNMGEARGTCLVMVVVVLC